MNRVVIEIKKNWKSDFKDEMGKEIYTPKHYFFLLTVDNIYNRIKNNIMLYLCTVLKWLMA